MPIHILTKFGGDWTKASKIIGQTTYWTAPTAPQVNYNMSRFKTKRRIKIIMYLPILVNFRMNIEI